MEKEEKKIVSESVRLKITNINLSLENIELRKELLANARNDLLKGELERLGCDPSRSWVLNPATGEVTLRENI